MWKKAVTENELFIESDRETNQDDGLSFAAIKEAKTIVTTEFGLNSSMHPNVEGTRLRRESDHWKL